MPITQRRERRKAVAVDLRLHAREHAQHRTNGSPPTEPSASTPKTFGKYPLNFPPNESKNKRLDQRQSKLPVGHVMLRAIDEYAGVP